MSYSSIKEIKKENIEELSKSFHQNILTNQNSIELLKSLSKEGELPKELRPIAWKIFLGILPNNNDINEWIEKTNNLRMKYKKKLKKYFSMKKYKGDPLSGNNSNNNKKSERGYSTLHEENELRRIINLDIVRTYQNINIFSQDNIKKLLINILFIWCKENEDVSYRQGMNELLAILILCFYPYYFIFEEKPKPSKDEIIKFLSIKDENEKNKYLIKIYNYFYDEEEIECDLFFSFDSLMKKGMKNLFNPKIIQKNEPDYKLYELFSDIFKDDIQEEKSNYISRRCFLLIHEKLKIIDEELYQYFKKLDINCGAFLQKWLRCIISRELDLDQVMILWDIILVQDFLNEKNQKYSLLFLDCVCLSMIIRIRNKILKRDQNDCFTLLFKYPHIEQIKDIIILSYNIYEIINEKIKGKIIEPKVILNIAKSFSKNDKEEETIKNINLQTPSSNSTFSSIKNQNENNLNKNSEEYDIKNNFLENKNNINNYQLYQQKSFINSAISSLGKIGNKLKEVVLGEELNNYQENNMNTRESRMRDLFDTPNLQQNKNLNQNINIINNNTNDKKKSIENIIQRLKRIDNKYNKYFEEEDKNELKEIITELLK